MSDLVGDPEDRFSGDAAQYYAARLLEIAGKPNKLTENPEPKEHQLSPGGPINTQEASVPTKMNNF